MLRRALPGGPPRARSQTRNLQLANHAATAGYHHVTSASSRSACSSGGLVSPPASAGSTYASRPRQPTHPSTSTSTSPGPRRLSSSAPQWQRAPERERDPAPTQQAQGMPLAGTVAPHAAVILLHTHLPPASYPPRSRSLLWRALVLRGRAWGALPNFAWAPPESGPGPGHALYAGYRGLGEGKGEGEGEGGEEAYAATVFAAGRRAPIVVPEVRLGNVEEVERGVRAALATLEEIGAGAGAGAGEGRTKVYLYVCTHGARDCRCGEGGGAVARALRAEVARRGLAVGAGESGQPEVVVGEIAHVGGHKYAANVLVYPSGDWLGGVQERDVPQLLDDILAWHAAYPNSGTTTAADTPPPPLCPPFWRGRMGLDKDEQLALFSASASTAGSASNPKA